MFMNCTGKFGSIVGREEDEYVIWETIYELCNNDLYKAHSMNLLASIVFDGSYGV